MDSRDRAVVAVLEGVPLEQPIKAVVVVIAAAAAVVVNGAAAAVAGMMMVLAVVVVVPVSELPCHKAQARLRGTPTLVMTGVTMPVRAAWVVLQAAMGPLETPDASLLPRDVRVVAAAVQEPPLRLPKTLCLSV